MTAILTKYLPATNNKPTRIKVWAGNSGRSIMLSRNECEDGAEKVKLQKWEGVEQRMHRFAAQALCNKFNWRGKLCGGSTKEGYAFVFVD